MISNLLEKVESKFLYNLTYNGRICLIMWNKI